jgi:hypothetical protein
MRTKFGLGAVVVVALAWAGALGFIHRNFQNELRTSAAALAEPEPGLLTAFSEAQLPSDSAPDSLIASNPSPTGNTANPAPVEHQVPELSCAQRLSAIAAESDPDARSAVADKAARSISTAELAGVLNLLKNNPSPEAAELRKRLVARWAEEDPPAAAAWAAELAQSPDSRETLLQIAVAWANTDLAAASAWANGLPDEANKQAVLLSLANEAARTEPLTALGLAVTLPPSAARDDALVHAISQWAGTDASGAVAWAEKVSDPNLRQRLLGAAAIAAAAQDGRVAANLVTSGLLQDAERDRAIVAVVQRWAQRSPAAAAAWLVQFPDSQARDAAVQHLVSVWALQNWEAAQNWVQQLPQGSLHNTAAAAYMQFVSRSGHG